MFRKVATDVIASRKATQVSNDRREPKTTAHRREAETLRKGSKDSFRVLSSMEPFLADFRQLEEPAEEFLRLNVSGKSFRLLKRTVFKRRRLCNGSLNGILDKFLTPYQNHLTLAGIMDAFLPDSKEFYFERSPMLFESILDFYRYGTLHCPPGYCKELFLAELNFWDIDPKFVHSCCSAQLNLEHRNSCFVVGEGPDDPLISPTVGSSQALEKKEDAQKNGEEEEEEETDPFEEAAVCPGFRRIIWKFVEDPTTSHGAKLFSFVSVGIVLISVVDMVLASLPSLQIHPENSTSTEPQPHPILVHVEAGCVIWFTFEFLLRFILIPQHCAFLKAPMNIIDLASILPFYLELGLSLAGIRTENLENVRGALLVLRILRVLRVARIFKLARYSGGLQSFGQTLSASKSEIGMLGLFISITIMLFSTTVYFLEKDDKESVFTSIPATFWWCIVTMTTVGYGDMVPQSIGGKLVASLTSVSGVIVLAFPITIIVENFNRYYRGAEEKQDDNEQGHKVHGFGLV